MDFTEQSGQGVLPTAHPDAPCRRLISCGKAKRKKKRVGDGGKEHPILTAYPVVGAFGTGNYSRPWKGPEVPQHEPLSPCRL